MIDNATTGVLIGTGDELTAAQLYGLLRLRIEVFVVEQHCPYPELDGRDLDPATQHLWLGGESPVGYLRLLADPDGARIGRVCVAEAERGRGHARILMSSALARLAGRGCVLDAQTYAAGFYRAFGFVADGEEFQEDGIPHIRMRRPATSVRS